MNKVSVISPSYNQGEFIQKCIDSVREQQGVVVEHIILDNCSTDNTIDLLDGYQKNPHGVDLKIIIEPDKGQTSAINNGFSLATGDIVCWLNTDEFYNPGTLALVDDFFKRHPDADILFGNCTFVDREGEVVKEKIEHGFNKNMLIYYGCYIPSCATFVRRRVIDQGCLLDESFRVCMDFDWYARLANAGFKFAHIPVSLAQFTWHETNISSSLVESRVEERHKVQLRYGGGIGSDYFRVICYNIIQYYYFAHRIAIRALHRYWPRFCL